MCSSDTHLVETNSCLTGLKTCLTGEISCLALDTNPGTVIPKGSGGCHKISTAAWQRFRKVKLHGHYLLPLIFILHIQYSCFFNIYTTWRYRIDEKFLMYYSCLLLGVQLLSFPGNILNILTLPLLGRYLYLLEYLHCILKLVVYIKTPEISL